MLHLITLTDVTAAGIQARAQIAPERGAIVTSFAVGDSELLYMDRSTLDDPTKNVRGGVPILFPTPGKLDGDRWQRDGQAGTMTQHGFARQMPWTETPSSHAAPNKAVLTLESNATTLQNYPWPFRATLIYLLSGACLRTTLRMQNTGNTVMPFALGYHPYFRVADKRHASIRTQAKQAYNNVSKQREAFEGFNLSAGEVDIHLFDHQSDLAALRLGGGEYVAVRASSDFSIWVVWTLKGKDFVCLEPWTAPGNALNTGERLIGLAPGASHESWMEIAYARAVPEA